MRHAAFVAGVLAMMASPALADQSHAVFAFSGSAAHVTAVVQQSGLLTTTIDALDRGWYNETGFHDPLNPNYVAGFGGSSDEFRGDDLEHRNFFVFDLADGTFDSATIRLTMPSPNGYISPLASETYTLYDVTTPLDSLVNGVGGIAAFNDLGSGEVYGQATLTNADEGTIVSIALNAAGLAAINAASGSLWAVGGAVSLVPVPEPASLALVGLGLVPLALGLRRRRRAA